MIVQKVADGRSPGGHLVAAAGMDSFVWGALAECFGNGTAPSVAALALVCGLAAAWRWPLHQVQRLDRLSVHHEDGSRIP